MALLPNMYAPIVTPDTIASLLPRSEYQGGPASMTMPSAPPIMGAQQPQVMPAQQVPAPAPAPAPVYDPVADMFVAGRNKYILDENGNVVQVPQDTGFMADTPQGMVSTLDPNLRQQAVSAGLSPENIAALAGDMRVSPSYTPPTAPTPLSAFRNPSENAGLDWMSLDDQLGYFFSTNAANPADVKGNPSAFVPLDENAGYRLYDARTGQYVAEGVGAQGLQDIYSTAQNLSATGGTNADWRVEMRKPGSESWSTMARDKPKGDVLGTVADIALPAIGAALAGPLGVAAPLAAAAGSGLSSVAQGRSLENTLLRAGLSAGATAAGGSLLGGAAPSTGTAAGQAAGEVAGQAAGIIGPSIIVTPAATSAAGAALGAGASGALANVVTPPSTPEGNVIEVVGNRIDPTSFVERAVEPFASSVANALGPDVTIPTTQGDPIIVKGARLEPMPGAEERITNATIASTLAGAIPTGGILQSGQTPTDGTTTMETGSSLLDDIIKYYSLGSIGLDALGGALGLGGGGGQAAAPYVSQLGPMPTFTRGEFRPYTGDYETYGFGPEFNFFGGPAPITPTAPAMGVLGPNTPVDTTLI